MSQFDLREWRKLYTQEDGTFQDLPFLCRGTAAQLLKLANRDGVIELRQFDLADTVCRRMAAHPNERRQVRRYIEMLIEDGFVVPAENGHWRIRNFVAAQTPNRRSEASAERAPALSRTSVQSASGVRRSSVGIAPVAHQTISTQAPGDDQDIFASELSGRNDTSSSLTYAGAHSEKREEEKREEEKRDQRVQGEPGAEAPREPNGSPVTAPLALPDEPAPPTPRSVLPPAGNDGALAAPSDSARRGPGPRSAESVEASATIRAVLEHWASKLYPTTRPVFDQKRIKRVRSRLAEGFTAEQLRRAIDGAALDDWLMGRADGARKGGWRDIETVFRDAAQVERLIALADAQAPSAPARRTATPDLDDEDTRDLTPEQMAANARAVSELLDCLASGRPVAEIAPLETRLKPVPSPPPVQLPPLTAEERAELDMLAATTARRRARIAQERAAAAKSHPVSETVPRGAP